MAMSGILWWTTDISGVHGGDIGTPYFRELIVRWFQYGVLCPIFRLHGHRLPIDKPLPASGANNEIWSFGDEAYAILRERLRPYIHDQMQMASPKGLPPIRLLFLDFANDPLCETVNDQLMFGPEILVAPVLYEGQRERQMYLPSGKAWVEAKTGAQYSGGSGFMQTPGLIRSPFI